MNLYRGEETLRKNIHWVSLANLVIVLVLAAVLIHPQLVGQDGDDGIEYYDSSYLGAALEDDIQFFPDEGSGWGCVSHPWLRDTSGNYVDVCGNAGDQFVSIRLPFGSFTTDQPALDVTVNAHLSIDADLTPDLLIYARGGFMYGETPEDDWCCGDAPFASPNNDDSSTWPNSPVTPRVMTFNKSFHYRFFQLIQFIICYFIMRFK